MNLYNSKLFLIYLLTKNKYFIAKSYVQNFTNNKKYPTPRWLQICESSRKQNKYPTKRWLKICESSKNQSKY